jgi:hypothetical protein
MGQIARTKGLNGQPVAGATCPVAWILAGRWEDQNQRSYIQDSKFEGVIPSPAHKLYLVWYQLVASRWTEISLDNLN